MLFRLVLFAMCGLLAIASCDAAAETRVALIIGNSDYNKATLKLVNPTNDAAAMQRALHDAGFDTILKLNATRRDMYRAVDDFSTRIGRDPHAVGLFYYAGHGVQADGANYLIPVDAEIESEADLEANAFEVEKILQAMKRAQNEMNIVILDACRDNPLPKTRSFDRGLARMDAPSGTFIAYAAAPGQVAHDGASGGNGVFTGELIKAMAQPDLPLEQMFKKVIAGVKADTHGEQQPWSEASVQGDFYFHGSAMPVVATVVAPPAPPAPPSAAGTHIPTPAELDEQYWQAIKDSKDPTDFSSYIKNFPKGMHTAEAELLVRKFSRTEAPNAQAPPPVTAAAPVGTAPQPTAMDGQTQQELLDYGVPPMAQLRAGSMEGPTPASIPGGRLITTRDLYALMRDRREPFLLLDALGGPQTLPGAVQVVEAAKPGRLGDYIEQEFGQWLIRQTGGNRNMAVVVFCKSSHCWMSYNAALRAIDLGYRNVLWYRGGIEAWNGAGLQTVFAQGNYNY